MNDIFRLPNKGYGYIYEYISPNGKKYIGQTTTSLIKRSGKRGKGYRECKVFYKAIEKYGFSNFAVNILEECEIEKLDEREKYYIEYFNTLIPYGYNIKIGGQNTGCIVNPVYAYNLDGTFYKKYINQAQARREFNINGGDISLCINGKLKFVKGKIWTNKYFSSVPPVTSGKNGAKPVIQIDPETNKIINIYNSASEAARFLGLSRPSGISKCCLGKSKKCANYYWSFLQSSTTKYP